MDRLAVTPPACFELHFQSLFHNGRAFAFPCDAGGMVEWQAMSERARSSYRRARDGVGIEFAQPDIRQRGIG